MRRPAAGSPGEARLCSPRGDGHGPDQQRGARAVDQGRLLRPGALRQDHQPAGALPEDLPGGPRAPHDARHQGRPDALLRHDAGLLQERGRRQGEAPALHGAGPGDPRVDPAHRAAGDRRGDLRGRQPPQRGGRHPGLLEQHAEEPGGERARLPDPAHRRPAQQARPPRRPARGGPRRAAQGHPPPHGAGGGGAGRGGGGDALGPAHAHLPQPGPVDGAGRPVEGQREGVPRRGSSTTSTCAACGRRAGRRRDDHRPLLPPAAAAAGRPARPARLQRGLPVVRRALPRRPQGLRRGRQQAGGREGGERRLLRLHLDQDGRARAVRRHRRPGEDHPRRGGAQDRRLRLLLRLPLRGPAGAPRGRLHRPRGLRAVRAGRPGAAAGHADRHRPGLRRHPGRLLHAAHPPGPVRDRREDPAALHGPARRDGLHRAQEPDLAPGSTSRRCRRATASCRRRTGSWRRATSGSRSWTGSSPTSSPP